MNARILTQIMLLFTVLLTAACGPGNTVRLSYPAKDSSILPAPNAPTVAVVLFTDKRPNTHLGVRSDNTHFTSTISVPEWISRSFADALSRQGLQVSYAETLTLARKGAPRYIVTGTITEAVLREISSTELRTTLQVDVALSGQQGQILRESLSASQNEKGLITPSTAEDILLYTMQELARNGSNKIANTIMKK